MVKIILKHLPFFLGLASYEAMGILVSVAIYGVSYFFIGLFLEVYEEYRRREEGYLDI